MKGPILSRGWMLDPATTRVILNVEPAWNYWLGRAINKAQTANAGSRSLVSVISSQGVALAADGAMMFVDVEGGEPTQKVYWHLGAPMYGDGRLVVDSVSPVYGLSNGLPITRASLLSVMPFPPPDPRLPGTPELVSVTPGVAEFTLSISETDRGYPPLTSFYYELYVHDVKQAQIMGVKPAEGAGPLYTVVLPIVNPLLLQSEVDIRVKAVNVDGRSEWSNMLTSTTLAPPITVPPAPKLLSVVATEGEFTLTLEPQGDGGSALIGWYFKSFIAGTDTPSIKSAVISIATLSYSFGDNGLTLGVAYDFVVFVCNAVGDSPASNRVAATPFAAPKLSQAPNILALNPTATGFAPSVRVEDSGNTPLTAFYYELRVAGEAALVAQGSKAANGAGPDYSFEVQVRNTAYFGVPMSLTVYADNAVGRSPASLPMTGQTL